MGSCCGRPTMAVGLTKPWGAAVEKNVRDFYETLSEKDRRRFAAGAARAFGYGGVRGGGGGFGGSRGKNRGGGCADGGLPPDPPGGQGGRPWARRKKKSS